MQPIVTLPAWTPSVPPPIDLPHAVTGKEHAVCNCDLRKAFNTTEPMLHDGRSVPCEMNKFDDMMELLSAANRFFAQVTSL